MKRESLKKVLESLFAIKASMQDVAETCIVEKLDEAIELIQQHCLASITLSGLTTIMMAG